MSPLRDESISSDPMVRLAKDRPSTSTAHSHLIDDVQSESTSSIHQVLNSKTALTRNPNVFHNPPTCSSLYHRPRSSHFSRQFIGRRFEDTRLDTASRMDERQRKKERQVRERLEKKAEWETAKRQALEQKEHQVHERKRKRDQAKWIQEQHRKAEAEQQREEHAAVQIQSQVLQFLHQRRKSRASHAIVIQAQVRRKRAQKQVQLKRQEAKRHERHERHTRAARHIQRVSRGRAGRKYVQSLLEFQAQMNKLRQIAIELDEKLVFDDDEEGEENHGTSATEARSQKDNELTGPTTTPVVNKHTVKTQSEHQYQRTGGGYRLPSQRSNNIRRPPEQVAAQPGKKSNDEVRIVTPSRSAVSFKGQQKKKKVLHPSRPSKLHRYQRISMMKKLYRPQWLSPGEKDRSFDLRVTPPEVPKKMKPVAKLEQEAFRPSTKQSNRPSSTRGRGRVTSSRTRHDGNCSNRRPKFVSSTGETTTAANDAEAAPSRACLTEAKDTGNKNKSIMQVVKEPSPDETSRAPVKEMKISITVENGDSMTTFDMPDSFSTMDNYSSDDNDSPYDAEEFDSDS